MLLDDKPLQPSHLIAGSTSGKPVYITPQAKPIYDELYRLAKRNNYWAQVTIKGIQDLAAGRLHKNNIFVHPGSRRRDGREEFVVVLPGCKVTAEKLDTDGYKLLFFEADSNYFDVTKVEQRPSMYSVSKVRDNWAANLSKSGKIRDGEDRVVAIGDSNNSQVSDAIEVAAIAAGSTPSYGGDVINRKGFDYHFTPGVRSLGGLKNLRNALRPTDNMAINDSALMLAKSMYDARNQEGVLWVSERGGSAVLTQALRVLADQGLKLNKHSIFMVEPNTSSDDALKQAHRLQMKLGREVSKVGFLNVVGNQGQPRAIMARLRSEQSYNLTKASVDLVKQGVSIQGGIGAITTLSGYMLLAGGISMTGPALPAALAFMGAVASGVLGGISAASSVVEQVAPRLHNQIKGKL
ncbi:hypothetical protein QWY82_07925 [Simiduia curdlanivorans]|uniref:Uncharacterized protein n=1 Tax=Simiduia curdlanivorans TaxID=1492769 RepID=A0ABV8V8C5_9GAMM|nr:hypothetical protein [Simiduia curdlanivorans]MDN3638732.1 hypothetical protein [Simiduia curdlanivorans]